MNKNNNQQYRLHRTFSKIDDSMLSVEEIIGPMVVGFLPLNVSTYSTYDILQEFGKYFVQDMLMRRPPRSFRDVEAK